MPRYAPPVFVDPTGRRARMIRRLIAVAVASLSGVLALLLMGLTTGGPLPGGGWLQPEPTTQQPPTTASTGETGSGPAPTASSGEGSTSAVATSTGRPDSSVVSTATPGTTLRVSPSPTVTRRGAQPTQAPTAPPGSQDKPTPSQRPTKPPHPS